MAQDLQTQLRKEVSPAVKSILDQIQEVEKAAQTKKQSLDSLKQELKQKEQEAAKLKQESQNVLGRGEDPRPILQQVSQLQQEQKALQQFLQEAGQPDKTERDKIQELKKELSKTLHEQIRNSKALEKQSQAVFDALQQAVNGYDEWNEAVKSLCEELGAQHSQHQLLDTKDSSEATQLVRRLGALASPWGHLSKR